MPTIEHTIPPYLPPPRLVRGYVWEIVFYRLDKAGNKVRVRKTFDLNRIKDLKERVKRAEEVLLMLAAGGEISTKQKRQIQLASVRLVDAVRSAVEIKCHSERKGTQYTYASIGRIFERYLAAEKLADIPVRDFDRREAQLFMDWRVRHDKIQNTTYNKAIIHMKALFSELMQRGYITENPFAGIPEKKEEEKERRAMTDEENRCIAAEIRATDRELYLVVMLLANCGIRPGEQARLRVGDVRLDAGIVKMEGWQTKNKEAANIPIPAKIVPELRELIADVPPNWWLFGPTLKPHPKTPCIRNRMNTRHSKVLARLVKRGELADTEGLSLYSWKDTAGGLLINEEHLDILTVQEFMRHKDIRHTHRYIKRKGTARNEKLVNLRADLVK